ncbi:hypothetical protein BD289DRAFT_204298 [Coniella lustricola]|uniref:Letm1 RBD domain-containing protein n=1 Tax=Coniella lustricola TaxID=2025994 RepID=A0A2T3ACC7_9PEZI|nr:hypothetical protein BD289DRAFT_204298 [Coniella lustricola]
MIPASHLRTLRTSSHITSKMYSSYAIMPRLGGAFRATQARPLLHQSTLRSRRFLSASTSSLLSNSSQSTNSHITSSEFDKTASKTTLAPVSANPPATTRPAPLDRPIRTPQTSTFKHLFSTGKAYLAFYKTGLKNIYLNTRLVWAHDNAHRPPPPAVMYDNGPIVRYVSNPNPPSARPIEDGTRAMVLLRRRWRHDVRRLPIFALILLICGEFTPFVVLGIPSAVPLTCRIPRQVEKLRRKAEERRRASFALLGWDGAKDGSDFSHFPTLSPSQTITHIARALNLTTPLWESIPLLSGTRRKVRRHLAFLEKDTALLLQAGGLPALEDDEVPLACEDRGINVLGRDLDTLKAELQAWVDVVTTAEADTVLAKAKQELNDDDKKMEQQGQEKDQPIISKVGGGEEQQVITQRMLIAAMVLANTEPSQINRERLVLFARERASALKRLV